MVSLVGTVDFVRIANSDEMNSDEISWNTTSRYSGWIPCFILLLLSGQGLKGANFDLLAAKVQVFFGR